MIERESESAPASLRLRELAGADPSSGDVCRRLRDVESSAVYTDDDELVGALVTTLRTDRRPDGRAAVRDVSLERMGERLLDVYESVLDGDAAASSEPRLAAR
ncbi:MAG: hypothetical protein ABEJ31_08995 [Haloarculaceae archaeon]